MSFSKNLNKLLLVGAVLAEANIDGNCSSTSIESQITSPTSRSMKTITEKSFQTLDRKSQNNFITSAIIAFSNYEIIQDILQRINKDELQIPVSVNSNIMLSNIALLYTTLQKKASPSEIKVKKTDTSTKLDSNATAEIQSVESSSDSSGTDSDEIQQLKSYLQIPESKIISLKDLRKRKAYRDIALSQIWLGNISLPSANKDDLFHKINEALESYQTYVILENPQEWNSEFGKDSRYLWTLMGMLHSYKDKLSENISVGRVLESLYPNKSEREDILKKSNNDMGKLIYFWLLDNTPEVLGEYTM